MEIDKDLLEISIKVLSGILLTIITWFIKAMVSYVKDMRKEIEQIKVLVIKFEERDSMYREFLIELNRPNSDFKIKSR